MSELKDLALVAWVGMDELGSGRVGIKQGLVPAGYIPLAAMQYDEYKLKRDGIKAAMELQAKQYGKRIRLVRFRAEEVILETEHGE
jgi:hypothetical protein